MNNVDAVDLQLPQSMRELPRSIKSTYLHSLNAATVCMGLSFILQT